MLVDELYNYRDNYVKNFGIDEINARCENLSHRIKETIDKLNEVKGMFDFFVIIILFCLI